MKGCKDIFLIGVLGVSLSATIIFFQERDVKSLESTTIHTEEITTIEETTFCNKKLKFYDEYGKPIKVWISDGSSKYHAVDSCGGSISPFDAKRITLKKAVKQNYERCKECFID